MSAPDLWLYESDLTSQYSRICGVDEAGRGPLAGPVCAAAVILPYGLELPGLNDSKKLTDKRRRELFDQITAQAVSYGIAFATCQEIDELNILNAAMLAMQRAVAGLDVPPDFVLIDGNRCPELPFPTKDIVGGDGKSANIAAASILAKVTRDRYMESYAQEHPGYGFEVHKGYPTRRHYEAIFELGLTDQHRRSFLRNLEQKRKTFAHE